jgi:hypothetical protein
LVLRKFFDFFIFGPYALIVIPTQDLLPYHTFVGIVEGRPGVDQLVDDAAKGPEIRFGTAEILLQQLGSHVKGSANECSATGLGRCWLLLALIAFKVLTLLG